MQKNQNQDEKSSLFPPRHESEKWRPKVLFMKKIVGVISPQLLLTQLKFPQNSRTCHQRDSKGSFDFSHVACTTTSIRM